MLINDKNSQKYSVFREWLLMKRCSNHRICTVVKHVDENENFLLHEKY